MNIDLSQYLEGAAVALVISAAVRALPEPSPNGGMFYRWFYTFGHAVLSNYDKILPRK